MNSQPVPCNCKECNNNKFKLQSVLRTLRDVGAQLVGFVSAHTKRKKLEVPRGPSLDTVTIAGLSGGNLQVLELVQCPTLVNLPRDLTVTRSIIIKDCPNFRAIHMEKLLLYGKLLVSACPQFEAITTPLGEINVSGSISLCGDKLIPWIVKAFKFLDDNPQNLSRVDCYRKSIPLELRHRPLFRLQRFEIENANNVAIPQELLSMPAAEKLELIISGCKNLSFTTKKNGVKINAWFGSLVLCDNTFGTRDANLELHLVGQEPEGRCQRDGQLKLQRNKNLKSVKLDGNFENKQLVLSAISAVIVSKELKCESLIIRECSELIFLHESMEHAGTDSKLIQNILVDKCDNVKLPRTLISNRLSLVDLDYLANSDFPKNVGLDHLEIVGCAKLSLSEVLEREKSLDLVSFTVGRGNFGRWNSTNENTLIKKQLIRELPYDVAREASLVSESSKHKAYDKYREKWAGWAPAIFDGKQIFHKPGRFGDGMATYEAPPPVPKDDIVVKFGVKKLNRKGHGRKLLVYTIDKNFVSYEWPT